MEVRPDPKPDPWRFALESIKTDAPTVLVMVVDHSGSVPGVTGTFVVVTPTGLAGTIGGGAAEHAMVNRARIHDGHPDLVEFIHTEKGDGTLCNGVQRFAFVSLARRDSQAVDEIVRTLDNHKTGNLELSPAGLTFKPGAPEERRFAEGEDGWSFGLSIGLLDTLTIVGGGHVALALSRVMVTLPFRVVVLDNRRELETMDANLFAHHKEVVDYEHIAEHVPEGDRSWVVVMTFGHVHDRDVVERLLGHRVRYLGLMGSAAKIKRLFADMEAQGGDPEAIARVRAPVGVSISSHTPEEIAVSVAAEIIGIRNGVFD